MSKIRYSLKNNFQNTNAFVLLKEQFFKTHTHPSKGVQKNMLKAWDFTKDKLCHRYFDNNRQKIFRTNILENRTRQILLTVVLMVDLWLKLQIEIVD